jgi:hypothetical protein
MQLNSFLHENHSENLVYCQRTSNPMLHSLAAKFLKFCYRRGSWDSILCTSSEAAAMGSCLTSGIRGTRAEDDVEEECSSSGWYIQSCGRKSDLTSTFRSAIAEPRAGDEGTMTASNEGSQSTDGRKWPAYLTKLLRISLAIWNNITAGYNFTVMCWKWLCRARNESNEVAPSRVYAVVVVARLSFY